MAGLSGRPGHVTVVGAGAIGVLCALYLRRAGWDVLLVDREGPVSGSSSGNAGSISTGSVVPMAVPGMAAKVPGWLLDPSSPLAVRWAYLPAAFPWLVRWLLAGTRRRARQSAAALAPLTLGAVDAWHAVLEPADRRRFLRRNGQLLVSRSPGMGKSDHFASSLREENGVTIHRIGASETRQLEPELSDAYKWGLFIPDSGHLTDPHAAIEALYRCFLQEGGTFKTMDISDVRIGQRGEVAGLQSPQGTIHVDRVVFAAGAHSGRFAAGIGDRIPLDTERGYSVTVSDPGIAINRPTSDMDRRFFATTMEPGLRIAGTVEIAGLEAPPNYDRARMLLRQGREMLSGLRTDQYTVWMGRRPSIPDSMPVLGPSPRAANVWYAFGHGHIGLTTAPTSGRLISEMISGETPHINVAPFRVDRFSWRARR